MATTASSTEATAASPNNPELTRSDSELEYFSYDDQIVRMFVTATILWGLVATLVGVIVALLLVAPPTYTWFDGSHDSVWDNLLYNVSYPFVVPFRWLFESVEFTTFGRLRPLHTNAAIFAFAGNGIFAAIYYSTQRLCKARMWSDTLSRLHFWGVATRDRFRRDNITTGDYPEP